MNETALPDDETSPDEETTTPRRPRRTTTRRTGALTRKTPAAAPRPKPAPLPMEEPEEDAADEPELVDIDLDGDADETEADEVKKRPRRRRRRPSSKKSATAEESAVDEETEEPVDVVEPADEVEEEAEPGDKKPRRRRRRRPSSKKSVVAEESVADEEEEPDEEPVAKAPARTRRTPARPARAATPIDSDEDDEKPAPRRGGRNEPRPSESAEPKGRAMGPDAHTTPDRTADRGRRAPERSAVRGQRQTGARELKPFVEKGFELVHLPDGTLVRSEMTKKNRHGDGGRRRPQYGDGGPGPALPGFDEIAYEPEAPPRGRQPLRQQGVILGDLPGRCRRSVNYLKRRLPLIPRVAVILGSGLSGVADLSNSEDVIDFADIPDFPTPSAPGHDGIIRVGAVEGTPTLFCEGRVHYYENGSMADTVYPVQALLALGVERFILTTSAGALNPSYRVGDLMFIEDQINLTGDNPFFATGGHDGPAFVDTTRIYDQGMIGVGDRLCRRARVTGRHGVLAVTKGPVYETPAERRMLAGFGADAVSMSVGPEAMVLAHAQATVVGLAVIVNEATAAARRPVSHNEVLAAGQRGAMGLSRLITAIIGQGW